MSYCIIIPARTHSTRLERKMLRRVGGICILEHTWRRAMRTSAERVVVATDTEEIASVVKGFGGQVQMTDSQLSSGTMRVHQAGEALGIADEQIIINVQGDEPLIEPDLIDKLAAFAEQRTSDAIATVAYLESDETIYNQANTVKVVCNKEQRALYFSRQCIPWGDAQSGVAIHIGVYAYTLKYLRRFADYPASPLELSERLEQLRALWHGDSIAVLMRPSQAHIGIDTQEDLERFTEIWNRINTEK